MCAELPPRRGAYRLGVFGSMCNPPHVGHLALVEAAHLDRIVVVPGGDMPPHRDAPQIPARTRLRWAVRAFADIDHVVVSDTEVERGEAGEPGYMVETLEELQALPGELGYDDLDTRLTLLVGADQLASLPTWHQPRRIVELAHIAVVERPGEEEAVEAVVARVGAELGAAIERVPMDPVDASSTEVRRRARVGDRTGVAALVVPELVDEVLTAFAGAGA